MYLHGYMNERSIGTADIDVVLQMKTPFTIIAHNQDAADHLEGLMLAYGKEIPYTNPEDAYCFKMRDKLTDLVFVTAKSGKQLAWDDINAKLLTRP